MNDLLPIAAGIAKHLKARGETIAVAESSTGGLIAAALLAVPGASAYFLGGAVVYTRQARRVLLGIPDVALAGLRPATEAYASLLANTMRQRFGSNWAIGESGATGPTGNGYGDPPGHCCICVAGPTERVLTLATGKNERAANMRAFAAAALDLLTRELG